MSNIAIETLVKERNKIEAERMKAIEALNEQRREIDLAIIELSGGKDLKDVLAEYVYDDENPEYIRQSAEEI